MLRGPHGEAGEAGHITVESSTARSARAGCAGAGRRSRSLRWLRREAATLRDQGRVEARRAHLVARADAATTTRWRCCIATRTTSRSASPTLTQLLSARGCSSSTATRSAAARSSGRSSRRRTPARVRTSAGRSRSWCPSSTSGHAAGRGRCCCRRLRTDEARPSRSGARGRGNGRSSVNAIGHLGRAYAAVGPSPSSAGPSADPGRPLALHG